APFHCPMPSRASDRKDSTPRHGRLLHPSSWAERDDRDHAAVSASSITLFLGLGESSRGPRRTSTDIGSIVPSITLTGSPACASSEVLMYSIMASSCSSVSSLSRLRCSTLCSRGHSSVRIFKYAAGCVRRTRSIAFGPPCRKSRSRAAINSPFMQHMTSADAQTGLSSPLAGPALLRALVYG